MGHILVRACMLLSILMFGFILGIIYQNQGFELQRSSFDWVDDEENDIAVADSIGEPKFTLKHGESNIIEMDDEDGIVVYDGEGGDVAFHESISHEPSGNRGQQKSLLFPEMGERTAGVFEAVFQSLFRVTE